MACDIRAVEPASLTSVAEADLAQARYLQTANVAMAGGPAKALRSRLFDGRPQPAECGAQILVRDFGEAGRDARSRCGVTAALRRLRATAKRGLPQPQSPDRLPAEEPVHPLEHDAGEVLDFDRGRSLDPQHERARLGRVAVGSPRPLDLFRLRVGGDLRAHDVDPAGDEFARGEA